MKTPKADTLSRRERQIMDILFAGGRATAQEVLDALPDPPTYSAVRGLLRVLEDKGHARHVKQGARYVYLPTQARQSAARSAMRQVLHTFFGGSVLRAVATLLAEADSQLTEDELARLSTLIDQAKGDEKREEAGSHD